MNKRVAKALIVTADATGATFLRDTIEHITDKLCGVYKEADILTALNKCQEELSYPLKMKDIIDRIPARPDTREPYWLKSGEKPADPEKVRALFADINKKFAERTMEKALKPQSKRRQISSYERRIAELIEAGLTREEATARANSEGERPQSKGRRNSL